MPGLTGTLPAQDQEWLVRPAVKEARRTQVGTRDLLSAQARVFLLIGILGAATVVGITTMAAQSD